LKHIPILFVFVLSILITATFAGDPPKLSEYKEISLEDIWKDYVFSSKSVRGLRSMKDGIHYTTLESKAQQSFIVKYKYETGEIVDTLLYSFSLITKESGDTLSLKDYQFSDGEDKIIIPTDVELIYRHSTRETNYIWDFKNQSLSLLSQGAKQRYATFSPLGYKVAFVRENDLWVKDVNSIEEIQITNDGKLNQIINGATDWVYEEEFGFDKAFFWSSDGSKIAFYRFDETNVKEFTMAKYGSLYPYDYKFKYPKAGEENAKVGIYIYDLETGKTKKVDLGDGFEYIPRIKWTKDPNMLTIQKMNRHQNELELIAADASTGKTTVIIKEKRDTYLDISDDLTFLKDAKTFIWTSDRDGYKHIYHYNIDGKLINQITSGQWDVTSFLGIDEEKSKIYYISAENPIYIKENKKQQKILDIPMHYLKLLSSNANPLVRNLYVVNLNGTTKKVLSVKNGSNRASFSNNFKYYINYFSDANTPSFVSLHRSDGQEIRVLEDNKELIKTISEFQISKKEFFSFKTSEDVQLNGWVIKPYDFDPKKKYPVLMYVYGGPGAQTVKNSWDGRNMFWYQLLAQKGCLIVSVDNRGTGARGADFQKCTYKELGKLETIDQIEAAKYLGTMPFVDKDRIGIWGWSYGGYMTSLCMTKGAEYFKLGIAVAPVTNWRYYDSIYTERYMQTPQENPSGYDDNSPINHVEKLKGKYLLIHGSADDNVHYQNSIEMVSALVAANKQFDLFIYPDKNHGIYGGNTRLHLYTKMTNFILDYL